MEVLAQLFSENLLPGLLIIGVLMPFWYLILYLFHRHFFDNATEVLKWCATFVLSFTWFVLCVLTTILVPHFSVIPISADGEALVPLFNTKIQAFYFGTGGWAILVMIVVTPIFYLRFRNKTRDIFGFVKILYLAILVLWLIKVVLAVIFGRTIL